MKELDKLRKEIDIIDNNIIKLLTTRMELALMISNFKSKISDKKREKELLDRVMDMAHGVIEPEFLEKAFKLFIEESIRLQDRNKKLQDTHKLMGFQGEHGAYSEIAAGIWNVDFIPIPRISFEDVFEGLYNGNYEYGIVPLENIRGGAVSQVNDLIIRYLPLIVGAVELTVRHCLMVPYDSNINSPSDLKAVYSHPQALSQCKQFLINNEIEAIPYPDTAGAGKMLSETPLKLSGAIASKNTAKLYNLKIIKENIEDLANVNITRFLVIKNRLNNKDDLDIDGNKCSILFSTEHKPGALFRVMEIFAKHNINLSRIESVPYIDRKYMYFIDFIGNINDPIIKEVLDKVKSISTDYNFLGCYKELCN